MDLVHKGGLTEVAADLRVYVQSDKELIQNVLEVRSK